MIKFSVLILGNASASPTILRNHTAQLININEKYFLVDCGEGTQIKLREHKIKIQRLSHIFISHLHGDHYLGLMGLIQTMNLLGRTIPLYIYCPSNIEEIVNVHLRYSESTLKFPIFYPEVNYQSSEVIFENDKILIRSIPLKHKIPCSGFLFKEKSKPRRINSSAINKYGVPKHQIVKLKSGEDFVTADGETVKNSLLTSDPLPSFSYAFCSDTAFNEKIIKEIEGVDLLYHEATFSDEHSERAKKTMHSTAKQAALIATKSNAKRLIIGHFSNRYPDLNLLLDEAKTVFENTELADQGKEFKIAETQ